MKKIIIALLIVLLSTPAYAGKESLFVFSSVVSGITQYSLNSKSDTHFRNFLLSAGLTSAIMQASAHDTNEALSAVAGSLFGCMVSEYVWLKYNDDSVVVGITKSW